jgi:nifR3 family TIM-barrel protein
MHPIGAQICGSKPKLAAEAARIIEDLGFDVIDLNCGCPVDKVTKDGSGSGLLQTPEKIGEILSEMVAAVKIPVTVKIRAGWDDKSLNGPEIVRIAESAGASALTVHGRTRAQGYKGPANWDHIRACKEAANKIQIIGNGDVFDAESAEKLFLQTGCDGILVARGTFGQPWIIEDIYRHLSGLPKVERTIRDLQKALVDHFQLIVNYQSERQALLDMRRVGCWYLKPCSGAKSLRMQINQASSLDSVFRLLEEFNWESIEVPGELFFAQNGG